jgi:UDPglucose 6-dehydrogenase
VSKGKEPLGVLGLGHVGLPTALGFAELGCSVIGADSDAAKVKMVREGKPPFYEPGLAELLNRHLASGCFRTTEDVGEAVRGAEILFICVGTPQHEDGSADLSQVESAVRSVAENLNGYKLIVEKSTAPVHTARWIERTILRYRKANQEFDIACNPEFLREGSAVKDFLRPDRIVLGVESERARDRLVALFQPFGCPLMLTDLNTAETIKHTANAFLALKISFINMVADLCDATGADVQNVARGIGLDPRVGPHFLNSGIGYGGFCLPKDSKAFIHVAEEHGADFSLLKEAVRVNELRVERFLAKVQQTVWVLRSKRVAIWGLAFKPETDDIREAPSLKIVKRLLEAGSRLRLYDPRAMENFRRVFPEKAEQLVYFSSAAEAACGADVILVLTEWPEFREVDWKGLAKRVGVPIIVDGRNCLDPACLEAAGFEYHGIGRQLRAQEGRQVLCES